MANTTQPGGLRAAAARPDADPFDLAFDAMPALVIGDLAATDSAWIAEHAGACRWCAEQLDGFRRLDATLDACRAETASPPAIVLLGAGPVAWHTTLDSPVGTLRLAATDAGICELTFAAFRSETEIEGLLRERGIALRPLSVATPAVVRGHLERAAAQLGQYFAGERRRFELPVDLRGVTPFTERVLRAAEEIPFGGLDTYRGLAGRIGKPAASRAVGSALGRNPVPVIVPCHRIVATGGGLGGYTGGLEIKQRLLRIEGSALGA